MRLRDLFVDPKLTLMNCGLAFALGTQACFDDSGGTVACTAVATFGILCWWLGEWQGTSLFPDRK